LKLGVSFKLWVGTNILPRVHILQQDSIGNIIVQDLVDKLFVPSFELGIYQALNDKIIISKLWGWEMFLST